MSFQSRSIIMLDKNRSLLALSRFFNLIIKCLLKLRGVLILSTFNWNRFTAIKSLVNGIVDAGMDVSEHLPKRLWFLKRFCFSIYTRFHFVRINYSFRRSSLDYWIMRNGRNILWRISINYFRS